MTPAVKLLTKKNIEFSIHKYKHKRGVKAFGMEAVELLGLDSDEVFKTLIVESEKQNHFIAIIPVSKSLDLKKLASALKCKSITMMNTKKAEKLTGYLTGAISPLAQKSNAITVIDLSARNYDLIYISGGRRGLEVAIRPDDFVTITNAKLLDISKGA